MDFYNYDYSYQASPGVTLLSFAVAILGIVAMWKIFEKAGEPGWAAIMPI